MDRYAVIGHPVEHSRSPDIQARFNTFAFETLAWSPEEIEKQAAAKSKVYADLVKRKNISLD